MEEGLFCGGCSDGGRFFFFAAGVAEEGFFAAGVKTEGFFWWA